MSFQKIQRTMASIWRLRVTGAYVLIMLVTTYLFPMQTRIWAWLALLWSFLFLGMYLIYYPIKYNRLSYAVYHNLLVVNCGVIYTRVKAIPVENIQFITVSASWLMQYFHLCTLIIHGAGGSVHIPGIKVSDADALREQLQR